MLFNMILAYRRFALICLLLVNGAAAYQKHLGDFHDEEHDGGRLSLPHKPKHMKNVTNLTNALDVLQDDYFALWQGIWPTAIDWTSAVMGTYLSAALITFSTSVLAFPSATAAEDLINRYFSQTTAFYFGQNAFGLRQEAYDDMLWVVLGWLESIKFIGGYPSLHYGPAPPEPAGTWYGQQWVAPFAHRARLFWDLASQGWNTTLCNGGMIWSPYLTPYKNAITNELYIAASISMYLYFPGDNNTSPFGFTPPNVLSPSFVNDTVKAHDPKYLAAAVDGYRWLSGSNMTDSQGLYVDGYHISGWSSQQPSNSTNTRCDARNEMVYTYNQGVLLSGQRGLYEATGARSYLEDGHKLVSDVIAATGWDLSYGGVTIDAKRKPRRELAKWYGLGRLGIMEEACDASGTCSQDGQTFKGIFFHHLTIFCSPPPDDLYFPGALFLSGRAEHDVPGNPKDVQQWHAKSCARYGSWIKHNAHAALSTVNSQGKFGMWWGAPTNSTSMPDVDVEMPQGAIDYRNLGVPNQWKLSKYRREVREESAFVDTRDNVQSRDPNDRGRGRTVETQGGGVSVLRAMWELVDTK